MGRKIARRQMGDQAPTGTVELLMQMRPGHEVVSFMVERGNDRQLLYALSQVKVIEPAKVLTTAALCNATERYGFLLEHFGVRRAWLKSFGRLTCQDGNTVMVRRLLTHLKEHDKLKWIKRAHMQEMADGAAAGDKCETLKLVYRKFGAEDLDLERCLRAAIGGNASLTADYLTTLLSCDDFQAEFYIFQEAYDADCPDVLDTVLKAFGRQWGENDMVSHATAHKRERNEVALRAYLKERE